MSATDNKALFFSIILSGDRAMEKRERSIP